MTRSRVSSGAALLALLVPSLARAEGTAEFGVTQTLDGSTRMYVDILDPATETITWEGSGEIAVSTPSGAAYGTYAPGDTFSVTSAGAWIVDPSGNEAAWDLSVNGAAAGMGRVWSRAWYINAGDFDEESSFNSSFYTIVDGGGTDFDGVVEMKTDGFAGYVYVLFANSSGVPGADGRSVSYDDASPASTKYPLYLNPPEDATYDTLTPELTAITWSAGATGCDEVAYGVVDGEFNFTASLAGTYHIVCDLNRDGAYDITSDDDLQLLGDAASGSNRVTWDGTDNTDTPVTPGTYDCQIILTVGEFHFVASDVETSYEGFRLFSLDSSLNRTGLRMYWNDVEVQSADETMPNGETSLVSSGASGVDSGSYSAAIDPNENARSWGTFDLTSKGNNAYLDTYTWIDEDVTTDFTITVADPVPDTDSDGLVDAAETCIYATDETDPDTDADGLGDYAEAITLPTNPLLADTDGDTVPDGTECPSGCPDTDEDGTVDAVDNEDDGDGILTIDEDIDGDGDPTNDDIDDDGDPSYLDADDDGDGVPTASEDLDGNGTPTNDDIDGDGLASWIDADDDGDGVPTEEEDLDDDGDVTNDDTDEDGTANWLDADDDNDGILSLDEDLDGNGTPANDDFDGDDLPDYLDVDSDDDGILDLVEGSEDTDNDGAPDFVDLDSDGDEIPDEVEGTSDTDGDHTPDFQDADDDGDGIGTIDESRADTDGDGVNDYLDDDDDDDGIPTLVEGGFDVDTDGDGTSDHLDTDSDADAILDEDEGSEDVDGDGAGNWRDTDSDGDTIIDREEGTVDSDRDLLGDWVDADDDGDTVPTSDEVDRDTDDDATPDHLDTDDDDDGILTSHEADEAWDPDVDGDGEPNWRDTDADGDDVGDAEEGEDDIDGDGVPNYLDPDGGYNVYYKGGCDGCASSGAEVGGVFPLFLALMAMRRRMGIRRTGVRRTGGRS